MIANRIAECYDGHGATLSMVEFLVVHHCSLRHLAPGNPHPIEDHRLTGPELAKRFRDSGLGTGGRCPYHVLILWDGQIEQLLPLDVKGAHVPGYNYRSIAVATVGERTPPSRSQRHSLIKVLTALALHSGGARIAGHTQLVPGAGKVCPHPGLDLATVRTDVTARLQQGWRAWPREHIDTILRGEGYQLTAAANAA